MPRQKARMYRMKPNVPRIIHSILLLVEEAQNRGESLTQYEIVKAIFLADKAHLNKYGRPITYDEYVAMRFGPVPSLVYDLLKENRGRMRKEGISKLPWLRRSAPELGKTCFAYEKPSGALADEILSPSDIEQLKLALRMVKSLTFTQIKDLTHNDKAYIDAWEEEEERQQFPMSYALLFEEPSDELAKELSFVSEHI